MEKPHIGHEVSGVCRGSSSAMIGTTDGARWLTKGHRGTERYQVGERVVGGKEEVTRWEKGGLQCAGEEEKDGIGVKTLSRTMPFLGILAELWAVYWLGPPMGQSWPKLLFNTSKTYGPDSFTKPKNMKHMPNLP